MNLITSDLKEVSDWGRYPLGYLFHNVVVLKKTLLKQNFLLTSMEYTEMEDDLTWCTWHGIS